MKIGRAAVLLAVMALLVGLAPAAQADVTWVMKSRFNNYCLDYNPTDGVHTRQCNGGDFQRWDPIMVGSFPDGRSAFEVDDILGNGWEWTSSLFRPFPGFEPFPFYRGYSTNFFDGKHFVMKGASPRTAACMLRRSFRNWFQAHYPFVYASFRCVSN